jgi:telomerase reverse transcriptase
MHRGHEDYGVVVKAEKSLANFNASTEQGKIIARASSDDSFPYCGISINTKTLEVSKKSERAGKTGKWQRGVGKCGDHDLTSGRHRRLFDC